MTSVQPFHPLFKKPFYLSPGASHISYLENITDESTKDFQYWYIKFTETISEHRWFREQKLNQLMRRNQKKQLFLRKVTAPCYQKEPTFHTSTSAATDWVLYAGTLTMVSADPMLTSKQGRTPLFWRDVLNFSPSVCEPSYSSRSGGRWHHSSSTPLAACSISLQSASRLQTYNLR